MAIDLGDIPSGTEPTTAEKLQIRKAIGVGTTDAPTFLAQTLTGQSLTGTQATSLVDMAATWNTTGTPSALKLNVIDTASNAASNLMDLQKGGVSQFSVTKAGVLVLNDVSAIRAVPSSGWIEIGAKANVLTATSRIAMWETGLGLVQLANNGSFAWSELAYAANGNGDLALYRDAKGILAQRNGVNAQAFRIYNSTDATPATNFDRGVFDFKTTTNTLRIGTENGGTYTTLREVHFIMGGATRLAILASGNTTITLGRRLYFDGTGTGAYFIASGDNMEYSGGGTWNRLNIGGSSSAFPAIKRNGTGIDIRLADDSGPAPLAAAKLELVTTAATGVRESILKASISDNATSAFHIYNATILDGKFVPGFSGSVFDSTAPASLLFAGATDVANDTGTSPLMIFTARTTTSTTDPNNGLTGSVTTRPLFAWWNNNVAQMHMSANGNLGIGTTTPTAKLTVTSGDIEVATTASGLILKSPDGTRYRVTAANGGTLSVAAV